MLGALACGTWGSGYVIASLAKSLHGAGFAEGQGLEVESQERGGLGMTYGEASPCVIFLILWHETENFSISLGICLG